MDISKNLKSDAEISAIIHHALRRETESVTPLTAGQCNALYAVTLDGGDKVVVKLASSGGVGLRRGEKWLMETETTAMKLMEAHPEIPAPRLLYYDKSLTVCDAPYFIMEYVDGRCLGELRDGMTDEEKAHWNCEMGVLLRKYTSIKGEKFGIIASGIEYDRLYDFIYSLADMITLDAIEHNVDLDASREDILSLLGEYETVFDEVTVPSFVHYDLWDNNLIVKDDKIAGLIDWERAIYGDPLMEDRFRSYGMNPDLLRGYGQTTFSDSETARLRWYDILMDSYLMVDVFTRQYEDKSQYTWAKGYFEKAMNELIQRKDRLCQ